MLGLFKFTNAQTPIAEELVGIHVLTQAEINALASPIVGTLVFNADTNENNESITIGTISPEGPKETKVILARKGLLAMVQVSL